MENRCLAGNIQLAPEAAIQWRRSQHYHHHHLHRHHWQKFVVKMLEVSLLSPRKISEANQSKNFEVFELRSRQTPCRFEKSLREKLSWPASIKSTYRVDCHEYPSNTENPNTAKNTGARNTEKPRAIDGSHGVWPRPPLPNRKIGNYPDYFRFWAERAIIAIISDHCR